MKLLPLILAAVVQVHAWQINFYSDENCLNEIQGTGGVGSRGCTDLPQAALAFQYFGDGGTLQLFAQENCGPAFLQQSFSTNCQGTNRETFSWAII